MSDSFPVVREKRRKSSKKSNKSFVESVTSKVSGLLPSTITKWFSNQSSSSANGSATLAESTDSSTEDEATDIPIVSQPPAKRMRYNNSPVKNDNYITTKCTSTNTESTEPYNSIQSQPGRTMFRRETNLTSTSILPTNDEPSVSVTEINVTNYNLQSPSTSNDTIDRKRKSLFDKTQDFKSVFESAVARSAPTRGPDLREPYFKAGLLCSPFYSGRTSYGGAAGSYMYQPNIKHRRSTTVKERHDNNHVDISHTARRIMDILENYSSPLREAKRIPQCTGRPNSSLSLENIDSSKKNYSYNIQELHVPKIASIIRLKQKSRIMDTTSAARQIIASHSSSSEYYPYPVSSLSTPVQKTSEQDKLTTKMKTRLTRTNKTAEESSVVPEPVLLPTYSLNIDQDNLPKFSFNTTPAPSARSTATTSLTVTKIQNANINKPKDEINNVSKANAMMPEEIKNTCEQNEMNHFKFSSPVKVSIESLSLINSSSSYIFGSPERHIAKNQITTKQATASEKQDKDTDACVQKLEVDKSKKESGKECSCSTSEIQNKTRNCISCQKKTNNIEKLDVEKSSEKWKCNDCWIQNDNSANSCVCCGAKKPSATPPPIQPSIQKQSAKWQCNDCWVQNDDSVSKCVCCGGAKASGASKNEKATSLATTNKETKNEWRCNDCWITNKDTCSKCVACGGAKPGGPSKVENKISQPTINPSAALPLQKVIQSQNDTWDCSICLVRNENNRSTCVICDAEKLKKQIESKFIFKDNPGALFKFGINPTESTTPANSQAKSIITESLSKESEANNNVLPKATFTFGIPNNNQASEKKTENDKKEEPVKQTFTFGINKDLARNPSTGLPKNLFVLPKKTETETSTKNTPEQSVEIPKVATLPTSIPSIPPVSNFFASPITSQSENKIALPSALPSQGLTITPISKETPNTLPSPSTSLSILPSTSLTNTETKLPQNTFTFSASTIKPNVNLFATPVSKVTTASSSFSTLLPTAVTSSMTLFNQKEPTNTATISLFQSKESTSLSVPVFGNTNTTTTTVASQLPVTSVSVTPMFQFRSGENASAQSEAPKFNFTFGSTNNNNNNNNEASTIFKPTFGTTNESNKLPSFGTTSESNKLPTFGTTNESNKLPTFGTTESNKLPTFGTTNDNKFTIPANIIGTSNSGAGNTLGGNGLSSSNNTSNTILPGINGLGSSNTLLGSGTNPLSTGNRIPTVAGTTTGLFGNPLPTSNAWPTTNSTPNTSTQFETQPLNKISFDKPPAFTFGSSNVFNTPPPQPNPAFSTPPPQNHNLFGILNQNSNNNQPTMFSNAIQSTPPPSNMFGPPTSTSTPAVGLFGTPNLGATPSFGAAIPTLPAFDPGSIAATPSFNFGATPPSGVFGFSQPQSQQLPNTGVYNFGGSSATGQVQFNMGSAPNITGRRVRKAIRRTTQR